MKAASIRNLNVSFNGVQVLRDVDLDIPSPGITVFLGRSGSGKTTLLQALNRLNEEFNGCVTSGEVSIDLGNPGIGLEPIYSRPASELPLLRRRVGMVFQTPNVLPVSVLRNIAMPLELVAACPKEKVADKVELSLRAVELWDEVKDRLHSPAERLSGGQQQRLCLARTLALEPKLLLLDEPTASLDIHNAQKIETLLGRLGKNYPMVLVSHSLTQAKRLADSLVIMDAGKVRQQFHSARELSEHDINTLFDELA